MSVYFTKGYLYQIALFFILQEAIESPFCHRIYLTRINQEFEADAFFPMFDENVYKLIRYLYCWCHRLAQWLTEISPTTSLHFLEGGNSFNRFLSIKQCGLLRRDMKESKVNNRRLVLWVFTQLNAFWLLHLNNRKFFCFRPCYHELCPVVPFSCGICAVS